MSYYKKIFKNRIRVAGSKGEKPSYLMPPSTAAVKVGYQIYEALDLICEGPVAGIVDTEGKYLIGYRATKEFASDNNTNGSSEVGIDKGCYFDDKPLRLANNQASHSKYDTEVRYGDEVQIASSIFTNTKKVEKIATKIIGPYSMSGAADGARKGTGSRDVRNEGRANRDFVNWQKYVPKEVLAKPYDLVNYDRDVDKINIGLQVDQLYDTVSFSTAAQNKAGTSKMGSFIKLTVSLTIKVGKTTKAGVKTQSAARFTTRAGNGVSTNQTNGTISITGVITNPYTVTLEGIELPELTEEDAYNFIQISKNQHETISNLVNRDIGVGTVTYINSNTYTYPNSCYVATSIDSKYYPQVPSRTYRFKGKRVLIPSNYHPVNFNGTDRRFSKSLIDRDSITTFTVTNEGGTIEGDYTAGDTSATFVQDTAGGGVSNGSKRWVDSSNGHTLIKIEKSGTSGEYLWQYKDGDSVPLFLSSVIESATATSEDYPWEAVGFNGHWSRFDGGTTRIGYNKLTFSNFSPGFPSSRGVTIYQGDWDGTFKFRWSDNPAWIYYDLLVNTRYGIGNYLRDVNVVDKWTLYEIGQYCDAVTMNDGSATTAEMGVGKFIGLEDGVGGLEPRFSCNILIKDQASAFEALQDLARSFRAMTYFNNSCVSVRVDRPHFFEDFKRTNEFSETATPKELKFPQHLIFNNLNVNGGVFSYADVDRSTKLTALEVSFLDKSNNFRSASEYVEDAEAIKDVGLNYKSIDGIGVTSRSQAHRLAKYVLFESLNTTETVSFGAGTEALLLQPGDIIRVDDEMRNFSKNYGTVIGTSGDKKYYDPDQETFAGIDNGRGPRALIVQPAINSTQFEDITGNIHVYNAIGKSGIQQFNDNPSANNALYKEIHNPSTISLKIKEGGSGTSFKRIDDNVENSGAFLVFIDDIHKFNDSNQAHSQWFSEKDALIKHGYHYSVDVTGRQPQYYRVIGVEEDNRNNGFNVSATIHHTGKFKFVEENISFDLDTGTFAPDLKTVTLNRPNPPTISNLETGQNLLNQTISGILSIVEPSAGIPQKYEIFLEEPNGNTVSEEVFRNTSSSTTTVNLTGSLAIDQIGEYEINVFSKQTSPFIINSNTSANRGFSTEFEDFGFSATSKFIDYQEINLQTNFDTTFDSQNSTGSGTLSYPNNDPDINSVFNFNYIDIFGRQGYALISDVSGQQVNLLNAAGVATDEGTPLLTFGQQSSLTISNADILSGFGTNSGQAVSGYTLDFIVSGSSTLFADGSGRYSVGVPNFGISGVEFQGQTDLFDENATSLADISALENEANIFVTLTGKLTELDSTSITGFRAVNHSTAYTIGENGYEEDDKTGEFVALENTVNGSTAWSGTNNNHTITKLPSAGNSDEYVWLYIDDDSAETPELVSESIPNATATSVDYPWNVSSFWGRFDGEISTQGIATLTFIGSGASVGNVKTLDVHTGVEESFTPTESNKILSKSVNNLLGSDTINLTSSDIEDNVGTEIIYKVVPSDFLIARDASDAITGTMQGTINAITQISGVSEFTVQRSTATDFFIDLAPGAISIIPEETTATNFLDQSPGTNLIIKNTTASDFEFEFGIGLRGQVGTAQVGTAQVGTAQVGEEGDENYQPASDDFQPASDDFQPASEDFQAAETENLLRTLTISGDGVNITASSSVKNIGSSHIIFSSSSNTLKINNNETTRAEIFEARFILNAQGAVQSFNISTV